LGKELAGGKLALRRARRGGRPPDLNRPDSRNALDHELLDGIAAAMPSLDRGIEVRCV